MSPGTNDPALFLLSLSVVGGDSECKQHAAERWRRISERGSEAPTEHGDCTVTAGRWSLDLATGKHREHKATESKQEIDEIQLKKAVQLSLNTRHYSLLTF